MGPFGMNPTHGIALSDHNSCVFDKLIGLGTLILISGENAAEEHPALYMLPHHRVPHLCSATIEQCKRCPWQTASRRGWPHKLFAWLHHGRCHEWESGSIGKWLQHSDKEITTQYKEARIATVAYWYFNINSCHLKQSVNHSVELMGHSHWNL